MSFIDNTIWLIQTAFTVYLIILWFRILLPSTHTSAFNPVSQLVTTLTDFIVLPLQKHLPKTKHFDYVTLIILFLAELLELYIVGYLQTDQLLNFAAVCLWAIAQALNLLLAIFFWSIIIEVVFSWLSTMQRRYYAIQDVLEHLTKPMLKPIRWILPPIGRFDFSPLIALLMLMAIEKYLVGPMVQYAILWAFNSSIDMI